VDAITLLKADTPTSRSCSRRTRLGEKAYKSKEKTVSSLIKVLSVHAAIEEQVFKRSSLRSHATTLGRLHGCLVRTLDSYVEPA
jgi:hypothetical protein